MHYLEDWLALLHPTMQLYIFSDSYVYYFKSRETSSTTHFNSCFCWLEIHVQPQELVSAYSSYITHIQNHDYREYLVIFSRALEPQVAYRNYRN